MKLFRGAFNGPAAVTFGGGRVVNRIRRIWGVGFGARLFVGVILTKREVSE